VNHGVRRAKNSIPGSHQKIKTLAEVRESLGLSFRSKSGAAWRSIRWAILALRALVASLQGMPSFSKGEIPMKTAKDSSGSGAFATLTRA